MMTEGFTQFLESRTDIAKTPALPVLKARRCCAKDCNKMYETLTGLREHLRKEHGKADVIHQKLNELPEIYTQSLRKRKRDRKHLQVEGVESGEYSAGNACDEAGKALEEHENSVALKNTATNTIQSHEESPFLYLCKSELRLEFA